MLRSGQVKEKERSLIPTVPEVVGISVPSSQAKKHVVACRLKGPLVADKTIDPSSSRETVVSCFSYKYLSLYIYSSFLWFLCRGARQVYTIVDGLLDHVSDFGLISVEPSMPILSYWRYLYAFPVPKGKHQPLHSSLAYISITGMWSRQVQSPFFFFYLYALRRVR